MKTKTTTHDPIVAEARAAREKQRRSLDTMSKRFSAISKQSNNRQAASTSAFPLDA
jgi:uncharacterized coiled-coil protein SlyX